MTTWHLTPEGHDVYRVTLAHTDFSLVGQLLRRELAATAAEAVAAAATGEAGPDHPRQLALGLRAQQLIPLVDLFDPAKVRGDQLRTHEGPLPWPGDGAR